MSLASPATAAPLAPAGDRPGFLAFVADEESEAALRGGLLQLAEGAQLRRGTIHTAIRALEREPTPRVLLVDISGVDQPAAALDALAGVCAPDVTVLVVGERGEISFYRELTRDLGVAEYLCKPLTRDLVSRILAPFLAGNLVAAGGPRGARVVTVSSLRGGAGGTTVAVNLALHLAAVSHGHVALLDLNLHGGTSAMMLGLKPGSGLRTALEQPERVDALLLERLSSPVQDRVRLIAAEEPLEVEIGAIEEGVGRLLELLGQRFNHVVVDMRLAPGAAERQVLAQARHRVLVLPPELAGIRDAIAARKFAGGGRSMLVLNRVGQPGMLPLKLVAEGLGAMPEVCIPYLPRHVPRAANLGRPVLNDSTAFRRALAPLTQEIAGVRPEPTPFGRLSGVWQKWRK